MIVDLTQGKSGSRLLRLSLPMIMSVVFQQLYNLVDSIIVGRFVGSGALGAVGASYAITMIFMAVATGASVGVTVIVSRFFGGKQYSELKTAVSTAMISLVVLGIVFSVVGALLSKSMLTLLNTPETAMRDAYDYLVIYFYGLTFIYIYNICNGAFTALGDANTSLAILVFSSVLNIGLDLVFVRVLHMGVAGAAWATLISQAVSAVVAVTILMRRMHGIKCEKSDYFDIKILRKISHVALPSILQHSFVSIGNLFVQYCVNGFGDDVLDGYTAAIKLNTFAISCQTTMSAAMSSFAAQNLGARRNDRVKESFVTGSVIISCISAVFFVAYFFFGDKLLGIFVSQTTSDNVEEVVRVGKEMLRIITPFYFVVGIKLIADGILRGGERMAAFMTSTFSDLLLRVVFAFVLSSQTFALGEKGIWLAWPIGWVVASVISIVAYAMGKWRVDKSIME